MARCRARRAAGGVEAVLPTRRRTGAAGGLVAGRGRVGLGRVLSRRASGKLGLRRAASDAAAFWDARLRDDAAARAWLDDGGYAAFLGAAGTFAFKPARAG
jgi:hypothetical protein